ncbi:MAG: hypothetical protein RLZZ227_836 [Pseudomonadota bacterium]|jgi:ribosome-associated protein
MRTVIINREPVELFKILKFEGLAESGGEAKAAIEQGLVQVNQVVETRKRKQIVNGDVIEFGGETLGIVLELAEKPQKADKAASRPKVQHSKKPATRSSPKPTATLKPRSVR